MTAVVEVGHARSVELLGHPARTDTDVEASTGQLVDRCAFRCKERGGAERRVRDAHADAHLLRAGCEPRQQRPALEPRTGRLDGQLRRKLHHLAEGVRQLTAVRRLWDDEAVERPDGIEVVRLGEVCEVREFLDGDVGAERGQVERELH